MIVYLDTSSLLKLFLEEEGSQTIERAAGEAEQIATSIVAYVESRSGLARARRDGRLPEHLYTTTVDMLDDAWSTYNHVGVTEALVRLAGNLAEKHALRAFDAIHLASAVTLQQESGEPISFSAWDERLMSAAAAEGLATPRP